LSGDEYSIRPFQTIEEYEACSDLQEETWGRGFSERVPSAILKVSQMLGGVAAGAYAPDGRLMGFVFGMTGLRNGETVHWSDLLAVRPEARRRGLGMRLKAYQRDQVLPLGIEKMYWTFDPLRPLNAYLNFRKLGIVAREYIEDMYGATDSPLHRGIGTDRLVALWLLRSDRVKVRLGGAGSLQEDVGVGDDAGVALASVGDEELARPDVPDLSHTGESVLVAIPADVGAIMRADPELARAWRAATRSTFVHYLARGYEVRDFLRGSHVSRYVLALRDDAL
jgi:predicted GNAT superfamily acetyltransferase